MKLSQLTAKPQLIEVSIDDIETMTEFGEPITFHTWDRQPLDTFMKLTNSSSDSTNIIEIVRTLILDEKGKELLSKDNMLPTNILMKAITKVSELLGK
jgi:hypothetical protein